MEGHNRFFLNQFVEIPRRSVIVCFSSLSAKAGLILTFEISVGIFKQSMGARKRVGIGVLVPAQQATQVGGIDFLESILGLLKRLKLRAPLFMTNVSGEEGNKETQSVSGNRSVSFLNFDTLYTVPSRGAGIFI